MEHTTRKCIIGKKSNRRIITRELYLRNDISCRSMICKRCINNDLPSLLSSSFNDSCKQEKYFIPDIECILYYLEILEHPSIKNVILLDSIFSQLKSLSSSSKLRYRIKNLLHNPSKCFISFPNEIFKETYTERKKLQVNRNNNDSILVSEDINDWNIRSLRNCCNWYQNHLNNYENKPKIILLHSNNKYKQIEYNNTSNFIEFSLKEYINNEIQLSNNNELLILYNSLKESYKTSINTSLTEKQNNIKNNQYSKHLSSDIIQAGIKSGIFYSGKLQVNKYYPQEASVSLSFDIFDNYNEIFIPSLIFQNRAIHDDFVAIELLPKSQWKSPTRKIAKNIDDSNNINTSNDDINNDVSNDLYPTGRVVGIVQRNWRLYSATIQPSERNNTSDRFLIAIPFDKRIPKIRIASRNASDLINKRLTIRIDNWLCDSQYPNGHYVSMLGNIGDIEAETKVLMIENNITLEREFSTSCMAHLPKTIDDWKITEQDIKERKDLRSRLIMSIDPPTCVDIDDALSIHFPTEKYNGIKVIEIGVHIADVTHFVPPNSLLDREARERGTSVYLADRRMDMLPTILSSQLCSLQEQQDRFAMSILWTINAVTYEILDIWYGKSIIFSSHAFSYQTADAIVNNKLPINERKLLDKKTGRNKEYNNVKKSLEKMLLIARKYRKQREENGCLELYSTEVKFEMTEQKTPLNINTKQTLEVMKMVEEFMVLANQTVAKRIYESFPTCSLLRRHPHPKESDFYSLIVAASALGFSLDVSSNKALAISLNKCESEDPSINSILRMLATKAMSEAAYFTTGNYEKDEFYHYGLAAEYYTHYTSPIRRYADIIVHRLLCESIKKEQGLIKTSIYSQNEISEICSHINKQNRNAKLASADSTKLFHSIYFKIQQNEQNKRIQAEGIIYRIKSNGFIIFVPEYGLKGVIYLSDINGNSLIPKDCISSKQKKYKGIELSGTYKYDKETHKIILNTNKGFNIDISKFFHCIIEIGVSDSIVRWPTITFQLVKILMESAKKKIIPIKPGDLSLNTKSQQSTKLEDKYTKLMNEDINLKNESKANIYLMFEQFRTFQI